MRPTQAGPELRWLEHAGVLVLVVAALVPRARDLQAPFDRGTCGFQGAFFALAAINYERLGTELGGGFPILNLDVELDDAGRPTVDPEHAYVYPHHPPTVPWLAWIAARGLGPDGWSEAWREGRPPDGLEAPLRLPFLAFHVAGLVLFWLVLRRAHGRTAGFFGLALFATVPLEIVYATLVDYEAPALCGTFLGLAAGLDYVRRGRPGSVLLAALGFGAATAVTYPPLPFVAVVPWCAWRLGRMRRAVTLLAASGVAAALPLAAHAWLARRALSALGRPTDALATRARHLLEPLWDGTAPFATWLARQWTQALDHVGPALLSGAAVAVLAGLVRHARRRSPASASEDSDDVPIRIGVPLTAAGFVVLLAFYRHTFDPQVVFLLWTVPGLVALVAELAGDLTVPLLRLRAGLAPFVVLAGVFVLPGLAGASRLRHALRAPRGDTSFGPAPELALPSELGEALRAAIPAGRTVLVPEALGFNLAVGYYAWRTVLPVEDLAEGRALATALGEGDAPLLATPIDAPPSARVAVEAFERAARDGGWSPRERRDWRVWEHADGRASGTRAALEER